MSFFAPADGYYMEESESVTRGVVSHADEYLPMSVPSGDAHEARSSSFSPFPNDVHDDGFERFFPVYVLDVPVTTVSQVRDFPRSKAGGGGRRRRRGNSGGDDEDGDELGSAFICPATPQVLALYVPDAWLEGCPKSMGHFASIPHFAKPLACLLKLFFGAAKLPRLSGGDFPTVIDGRPSRSVLAQRIERMDKDGKGACGTMYYFTSNLAAFSWRAGVAYVLSKSRKEQATSWKKSNNFVITSMDEFAAIARWYMGQFHMGGLSIETDIGIYGASGKYDEPSDPTSLFSIEHAVQFANAFGESMSMDDVASVTRNGLEFETAPVEVVFGGHQPLVKLKAAFPEASRSRKVDLFFRMMAESYGPREASGSGDAAPSSTGERSGKVGNIATMYRGHLDGEVQNTTSVAPARRITPYGEVAGDGIRIASLETCNSLTEEEALAELSTCYRLGQLRRHVHAMRARYDGPYDGVDGYSGMVTKTRSFLLTQLLWEINIADMTEAKPGFSIVELSAFSAVKDAVLSSKYRGVLPFDALATPIDPHLESGSQFLASALLDYEQLTTATNHRLSVVAEIVALSARDPDPLQLQLLLAGAASSGKSFIVELLRNVVSCRMISHESALAATAPGNDDGTVTVMEEIPKEHLGLNANDEPVGEGNALHKAKATQRLMTSSTCAQVDAERINVTSARTTLGAVVAATNANPHKLPEPVRSRFIVWTLHTSERPGSMPNDVSGTRTDAGEAMIDLVFQRRSMLSNLVVLTWMFVEVGVLDINMANFDACLEKLRPYMPKRALTRSIDQVRKFTRSFIVAAAVQTIVIYKGSPLSGNSWSTIDAFFGDFVNLIIPLLACTCEHVLLAFQMLDSVFFDPIPRFIANAVADITNYHADKLTKLVPRGTIQDYSLAARAERLVIAATEQSVVSVADVESSISVSASSLGVDDDAIAAAVHYAKRQKSFTARFGGGSGLGGDGGGGLGGGFGGSFGAAGGAYANGGSLGGQLAPKEDVEEVMGMWSGERDFNYVSVPGNSSSVAEAIADHLLETIGMVISPKEIESYLLLFADKTSSVPRRIGHMLDALVSGRRVLSGLKHVTFQRGGASSVCFAVCWLDSVASKVNPLDDAIRNLHWAPTHPLVILDAVRTPCFPHLLRRRIIAQGAEDNVEVIRARLPQTKDPDLDSHPTSEGTVGDFLVANMDDIGPYLRAFSGSRAVLCIAPDEEIRMHHAVVQGVYRADESRIACDARVGDAYWAVLMVTKQTHFNDAVQAFASCVSAGASFLPSAEYEGGVCGMPMATYPAVHVVREVASQVRAVVKGLAETPQARAAVLDKIMVIMTAHSRSGATSQREIMESSSSSSSSTLPSLDAILRQLCVEPTDATIEAILDAFGNVWSKNMRDSLNVMVTPASRPVVVATLIAASLSALSDASGDTTAVVDIDERIYGIPGMIDLFEWSYQSGYDSQAQSRKRGRDSQGRRASELRAASLRSDFDDDDDDDDVDPHGDGGHGDVRGGGGNGHGDAGVHVNMRALVTKRRRLLVGKPRPRKMVVAMIEE